MLTGTWKPMDDALSGTWQQNTNWGPAAGLSRLPKSIGLLRDERPVRVADGRFASCCPNPCM